jgi:hypothetical protein
MHTPPITAAWIADALSQAPAAAATVTVPGTTWQAVLELAALALRYKAQDGESRSILPDIGTPGKRFAD